MFPGDARHPHKLFGVNRGYEAIPALFARKIGSGGGGERGTGVYVKKVPRGNDRGDLTHVWELPG